jgi:Tfp pilus assembly protein PilE
MMSSLIKFVLMVSISAVMAVIVVSSFDAYYQDLEARRRAKWEAHRARSSHPANSGPRYE